MTLVVPELAPGELHLWRATVDPAPAAAAELEGCLSSDERERAARRHRPADRRRYVTTRAILRRLLAAYSAVEPADLCFDYGAQGKPELAAARHPQGIRFNVSHSGPLALYGFTLGAAVGVDLERVRPLTHAARIAERVFPPAELESWARLEPEQRLGGFFTRWTRLEALAKMHGGGVWWLVENHGSLPVDDPLTVLDLAAPSGFTAAAAVAGRVTRVLDLQHEPAG